jgi:hypothetical protein
VTVRAGWPISPVLLRTARCCPAATIAHRGIGTSGLTSTSTCEPATGKHAPAAGAVASGGTLCIAGAGCADDGRDDAGALVGVDETGGSNDVVDATADIDDTVEVVARVVPLGPVPPP